MLPEEKLCFPKRHSVFPRNTLVRWPHWGFRFPTETLLPQRPSDYRRNTLLFLIDTLCIPMRHSVFHISLCFHAHRSSALPTGVFCFPLRPSASNEILCFRQDILLPTETSASYRESLLPKEILCFPQQHYIFSQILCLPYWFMMLPTKTFRCCPQRCQLYLYFLQRRCYFPKSPALLSQKKFHSFRQIPGC
jgi:hypothetical protein